MEESKNNKKIIIIVVLILFIICLVASIIGFLNKNKNHSSSNLTNNQVDNATTQNEENNTTNNQVDNTTTIENINIVHENDDIDESYEVFMYECLSKNCTLYKDSNLIVEVKDVEEKDEDTYSCNIYVNNKFSKNIEDCGDDLYLENVEGGFLIKVASESFFVYFYLFNNDGTFISDFSEEKKKFKDDYIVIYTEGGQLIMSAEKYTSMDDGDVDLIKDSYCDLKPKATDIFRTLNYYKINNNKLEVYETKTTTWADAYKCKDDVQEDCGDITKVDCTSED